jgi:hypothetical protein
MNTHQALWWRQAKSDHDMYVLLRKNGGDDCHQLHFLQMATEKLGKAYQWSSGSPPARSHAGFVQFMRQLGSVPRDQRDAIAATFNFTRFRDFQAWINAILPLAYELQRLAPALANDGPNPEYPWPQEAPTEAPVTYEFPLSVTLRDTGKGRGFIRVLEWAVDKFPAYA